MNGEKVAGIGGVRLELLPEAENVIVHGASGGIVLVAPDFVEKNIKSLNSWAVRVTSLPAWVASILVKSMRASPKTSTS